MSKCRQHSNDLIETEIGRIPGDWDLSKLSNIAQVIVSNVDKKFEEYEAPVLLCNYMDVYQNEYITSNLEFMRGSASEAEIDKFSLRRGDVLITKDSETAEDIASAAVLADEIQNLICGYHLAILRPDIERMDSNFFAKTLQHDRVHNQFVTKANGVTRYGLTLSVINNATIPVPPLIEQAEIARILTTWDRAIEQVQRLIEAKQRQKKGLMQGLLTGRLRFPEFGESINTSDAFPTDWEVKKLKQVFSQIDRPLGSRIPESVLSISAKIGFVDQKTKFGKVVAGKSLEKYILLQRGEFAYNRGNSNAYPQGCIYMLTEYDEGAIPNVYYAFRVKSGNIFPQFYQYYFESGLLNPQLKMFISSSARGDGLFNISSKDFFGIKIVVPPFEEQKKIASVLGGMDEQIALLKKYLVKLKKQKNGLMQKLLTGEIRVKVD